jgi:hypothetical protein
MAQRKLVLLKGAFFNVWTTLVAGLISGVAVSALLVAGPMARAEVRGAAGALTVPVKVKDLAYSPLTRLLYASVPGDDTQYPNSVAVIDPRSGAVVTSVAAGNNPSRLAVSDDGRDLYCLHDKTAIDRYDLTTLRTDQSFQSTMARQGSTLVPWDIRVMPGQPDVVAVSLVCDQCTGLKAIAIYDKGIMRPVISADTYGSSIAFTSQDTLWAIDGGGSNDLWRYSVDSTGVARAGGLPASSLNTFNRRIQSGNGMIYGTVGDVYDPVQASVVGLLNTDERLTNAFAIDAPNNRGYFLVAEQYETNILAFDLKTYLEVASFATRTLAGINVLTNNVMALCGDAGIAVAAEDQGGVAILPMSALETPPPYVKPDPVKLKKKLKPRIIALPTNNLTYDEHRGLIYASIPGAAGSIGNSIVAVDPFKGSVGDPIWIGSEPQKMAISPDGSWLETALNGSASIRRVRLMDQTPDQSFRLRTDFNPFNPMGTTRTKQVLALPGAAGSVVVNMSRQPAYLEAGSDGIAVYDNGIRRPVLVPGEPFGGIQEMQLSEDGVTLYGIEDRGYDYSFVTMAITQDGIQISSKTDITATGFHLKCQNGLCFTETGGIIDAQSKSVIGQFPLDSIEGGSVGPVQVAPDVAGGVVYFAGVYGYISHPVVSAFDLNTRKLIGFYEFTGAAGSPVDFFLWGGDQLAFNTGTQIILLPTKLVTAAQ